MANGRLERSRELLISHGEVISGLFDKDSKFDRRRFVKYGMSSSAVKEELSQAVHEKVAKAFRDGRVVFD